MALWAVCVLQLLPGRRYHGMGVAAVRLRLPLQQARMTWKRFIQTLIRLKMEKGNIFTADATLRQHQSGRGVYREKYVYLYLQGCAQVCFAVQYLQAIPKSDVECIG